MTFSNRLKYFLFSAAALFLFFFFQNLIPLWSSDEGRFSEVAREMWLSKNFIIPHFNYVAFLDKPILAPLLTCVGYAIFGVSSLTSRLVPILSALLGIFMLHRFALRLFNEKTADYSALFLLTTIGYVLVGRFAVIDMLMTLILSITLFCMFTAFYEKKPIFYLTAYFFMGFGFLTKGLIGIVLPSGIFFVFLLWSGNLKELLRIKILWGLLIISAVVLPWFLLAMKQKRDFFDVFIIQQHVHRFATATFGRKRPFWFFIPIFFGLGLPWSFFIPAAVIQGMKEKDSELQKIKFLICWILGIVFFFSIPKSKLPYYILPATVPTALLIGHFFSKLIHSSSGVIPASAQKSADPSSGGKAGIQDSNHLPNSEIIGSSSAGHSLVGLFRSWMPASAGMTKKRIGDIIWVTDVWKLLALTSSLGAIGLNIYLSFFADKPEVLALKNFALFATLLLAAGFVTAFLKQRSYGFSKGIFYLAATVYLGLLLTACGMKIISPLQSSFEEAQVIQAHQQPGDLIAVYSSPDRFSDLPFHLKRRVTVAGSDWGTLKEQSALLSKEDQAEYFFDTSRFVSFFNARKRRVIFLMESEGLQELQNNGLKNFTVLKQGHEKVVISNF